MTTKLDVSAHGSPRNALLLAEACALAYLDEPEAAKGFREDLGLEARLIGVDNTQVYVAQNDEVVLVAFRGSQCPNSLDGLKDWLLTNANNYLIVPEGRFGTEFAAAGVGARFHRGFIGRARRDLGSALRRSGRGDAEGRAAALDHRPQPGGGASRCWRPGGSSGISSRSTRSSRSGRR